MGQDLAKAETEPALREFVAATWPDGTAPSVQTIFKTPIGDPTTVILETAAHEAVDLIVMGTQGLGGFRKWLLGSTTERLLRRSHVPVLVVPLSEESGVPRVNAQFEIGHILAATDFSESSVAAVKYAAQLARRFSATLALTHVVEPLTVPSQWRPLAEESDETRVATARDRLTALADECCGGQECEADRCRWPPGRRDWLHRERSPDTPDRHGPQQRSEVLLLHVRDPLPIACCPRPRCQSLSCPRLGPDAARRCSCPAPAAIP